VIAVEAMEDPDAGLAQSRAWYDDSAELMPDLRAGGRGNLVNEPGICATRGGVDVLV
jgi:hypothetical protein